MTIKTKFNNNKNQPLNGSAENTGEMYDNEVRVTVPFKLDQLEFLDRLQRNYAAHRPLDKRQQRLTKNMIVRSLVKMLMRADEAGLIQTQNVLDEDDMDNSIYQALLRLGEYNAEYVDKS